MFIFRSRRSTLVKRLWRLQPGDDNNRERRAVASAVLKRLKEPALEGLVRALEGSGKDSGVCCLVPRGGLRLGRLGTVSPQVLTAQLFRWPDVEEEEQLVQVTALCQNQDNLFVCCNPWHWARALPAGFQSFLMKIEDKNYSFLGRGAKKVTGGWDIYVFWSFTKLLGVLLVW